MKYINKRNDVVVQVVSEDPKFKTLIVREVETGKEKSITTSTFKRWYKKVEEPVALESVVEEPAPVEEQVVAPEPVAPEPQVVAKSHKAPRGMTPDVKALHEYVLNTCLELGGNIFVPSTNIKFRGLKVGKNNFIKYNWSNKSVMLFVRAKSLGLDTPITPVNHTYNDKYVFREDTPENRAEIYRIMKTAYDWQVARKK